MNQLNSSTYNNPGTQENAGMDRACDRPVPRRILVIDPFELIDDVLGFVLKY